MFSVEDLSPCLTQAWFSRGFASLERNLLLNRLGMATEHLPAEDRKSLGRFSQAVMASASGWDNPRIGEARRWGSQ